MTAYEPNRARRSGRRSTVAIVVGVALTVLVLVAAVTSLRTGDDGGDQATPSTVATSIPPDGASTSGPAETSGPTTTRVISGADREEANSRLLEATPVPGPVPPGDYGPVCTELTSALEGVSPATDVLGFLALLDRLNLPKLALLAPASIRPSYIQLLDSVPAARDAARKADGIPAPDDLPPGFLASIGVVLNSFAVKCPGLG